MLCFLALCQIICLFMYFYYLQKSRNVMFSGTVPDYLFICVFLLFPEVQKCHVFRHCVRLFVYLCISIISRSPEMSCFQALCQIICLFVYFYYFQKCHVYRHCARLFMYFYYFQKSRNVMFSGTVSDYLFIYVFLLFPEVQKCHVFRHCARLFVYLCISIISRSPEMSCLQALCQIICLFMYFYYFQNQFCLCFQALCTLQNRFQNHCIMTPSIRWTQLYCSCEYTIIQYICNYSCKVSSVLVLWKWPPYMKRCLYFDN